MGRRVDRRVEHGAHELSLGGDQRSADVTKDQCKAPKARPRQGEERRTQDFADQTENPYAGSHNDRQLLHHIPELQSPAVTPYASR